jgi:signal transduction histidine kinase
VSDGTVVGSLNAYFSDAKGRADSYQLNVIRLLAACAAHLYRESTGLPVYPDGPMLPALAQGMAVVGPDAAVRSWSPAAARLTGRPFESAIGRPLPFPVPGHGQVVVHRLDPGRWIRARATALTGTDATVVTFREITEPAPGDQARDLFIAVTSHELRTPVTVIRGYADTLVERWDNLSESDRREAIYVVGQRARELSRLVDRLLNSASDVAGLVDGASGVPFDLVEAVVEAVGEMTMDLRNGVRMSLPRGLPKALGERASIATLLTELITNAFKYSPERVDIEVVAGADAQTVWFRVSDRGVGIRPEHTERAFERFWQLDATDQRRYGGVGLGLYLVRRIVERQKGWVSLRPRDGGGTVAEVRLPRADASTGEG